MNESNHDPRQPQAASGDDDADVARALRLAAALRPSSERRAAAFERVHAEWRAAVASRPATSQPANPLPPSSVMTQPERRSPWRLALAASVAAAAIALALLIAGPGARSERVAVALAVSGARVSLQGSGVVDHWLGRERVLAANAAVQSGDALSTGDGTAVLLKIGQTLTLRVAPQSSLRFDAPDEITLLRGQVYVDSGAGSGSRQLLTVATAFARVQHVGTRYLIRLLPAALEVAVREGRVRVSSGAAAAPAEAGAGERLRLDGGTGAISRDRIAPSATDWAWLGQIPAPVAIDGETLDNFLAWYAAESGRRVDFGDATQRSRLGSVRLRGNVTGLSPDQALDAVAAIADLTIRHDADRVTIDAAAR